MAGSLICLIFMISCSSLGGIFLNQMISFENFCTYAYLKFMSVIFLKPIVWLVL